MAVAAAAAVGLAMMLALVMRGCGGASASGLRGADGGDSHPGPSMDANVGGQAGAGPGATGGANGVAGSPGSMATAGVGGSAPVPAGAGSGSVAGAMGSGVAGAPLAPPGPGVATIPYTGRHIPYVFVLALENHDAGGVYGNQAAYPYLNNELLPRGARATGFHDELPMSMPSEPHYVWMEAGTNVFPDHTFTSDGDPSASNSTSSGGHLVTQLASAQGGADWTSYQEGIDGTSGSCPIAPSGYYRPRHNPFVFFQDIAGGPPSKTAQVCAAHHKPASMLGADLGAGTVTAYNFITPDLCHDAHGATGCPSSNFERASDDWMRANLPAVVSFLDAHGGVLFIVWDEGDGTATIPFVAVGPHVKPGYANSVLYDHGSLVKSLEEIFGLPFLPAVASSNDFADLFVAGSFP
jgi:phosphatidylinositol-3-phosphatase